MEASSGGDVLSAPEAGAAAVRGGVLRVATYLAGVVIAVGSAALLFNHLGVVDAGRYVLILSVVALFGGLLDAGLSTIGLRELAIRGGGDRDSLFRNMLGLRIALTGLGALLACGWALIAGYGTVLVFATAIAGVGLMLQNLQSAYATALMAELRLGWVSMAELLRQMTSVLAIVALVLAGASLLPFFLVAVIAGLAGLLLTVSRIRNVPLRPAFELPAWRALLRQTLPFALAVAVGSVYYRVAILLVELLSSETQTGYFGASFRIVDVLLIVPQLVVSAAFPIFARAARDDRERLRHGLERMLQACLLLGAGTAVLLFTGADFAIEVISLGDDEFDPAAEVLQIQGLALAASFVAAVGSYGLLSIHAHRLVLTVNLVALAVAVALLVPLTLADGARGAALATLIAEVALAAGTLVALARAKGGVQLGSARAARILIAAVIAAGVVLLGLPSVIAAALAGAVFTVLVLVLGAVPAEIAEALPARLRRRRRSSSGGDPL